MIWSYLTISGNPRFRKGRVKRGGRHGGGERRNVGMGGRREEQRGEIKMMVRHA